MVSMLSAGANAKIPSDLQIIHTAFTSVGSNIATQELETHHLDIESLAANVLGTTLGQAATKQHQRRGSRTAKDLKAYVEAQFAGNSNSVMPAKAGIQGNGNEANNSNSAINSKNRTDSSSQNTNDTPSNRYAKLRQQTQDADPNS